MTLDAKPDDFETGLKPLWLRAPAGDEAAYRAALERIARRLRAFFGRRLSALPDEVEDLVQETLLALHLQRGTYDANLPVSAWVHAIARHKLVDLWRRRGRREALHEGRGFAVRGLAPRLRELARLYGVSALLPDPAAPEDEVLAAA